MLSDDLRRTVADALRDAERDRSPIPPLRETWPEIDVVDSLRFWALRLHDVGAIKSSPQKIIAEGTDLRFPNELKRELKT